MKTKTPPTTAQLTKALASIAPHLPAFGNDLTARRVPGARYLSALERAGWLVYDSDAGWFVTRAGKAVLARAA